MLLIIERVNHHGFYLVNSASGCSDSGRSRKDKTVFRRYICYQEGEPVTCPPLERPGEYNAANNLTGAVPAVVVFGCTVTHHMARVERYDKFQQCFCMHVV